MTASKVTLELDQGEVTLAFVYAAIGEPVYSDVMPQGPWLDTYEDAEQWGAKLVGIGNWRSFAIEKRYFAEGAV